MLALPAAGTTYTYDNDGNLKTKTDAHNITITYNYDALHRLLEAEEDLRVVAEAADGREALRLVEQHKPDLLLLDLAMPNLPGLDTLRELAGASSPIKIILLTAAIEKEQILEALQLGAHGVVLKESASQLLLKAIRCVHAGQYWVGRGTVSDLVDYVRELAARPEPPPKRFGLTPRELEVIAAIVAGCTNKDIARDFSISEDTVKHHLTNIFDKLGVSNRLELALFTVNNGLVQRP